MWLASLLIKTFQHYEGFVIPSHWCPIHVCGMFPTIWYSKKTFFAYFSCILPICDYYHACFWGDCLAGALLFSRFIHIIALVFLSSQPLSGDVVFGGSGGGGWGCFCQTTHFILVSGGIWTGYDACLSFIPLLPDGNQLIIHYYCFFRHGANIEQIVSCSVGRKVHCSILIKTADFLLKENQHHQTWWKHLAVQCSI